MTHIPDNPNPEDLVARARRTATMVKYQGHLMSQMDMSALVTELADEIEKMRVVKNMESSADLVRAEEVSQERPTHVINMPDERITDERIAEIVETYYEKHRARDAIQRLFPHQRVTLADVERIVDMSGVDKMDEIFVKHTLDQLKKSMKEGVYEAIIAGLVDKNLSRECAEKLLWFIACDYVPFVRLDQSAYPDNDERG